MYLNMGGMTISHAAISGPEESFTIDSCLKSLKDENATGKVTRPLPLPPRGVAT